jgi:hypothetical protein
MGIRKEGQKLTGARRNYSKILPEARAREALIH